MLYSYAAMKKFQREVAVVSVVFTGAMFFAGSGLAQSDPPSRENAQAILEDVKKRRLENQIASKQIELQRLEEDHTKRQEEAEGLQRSLDTIASAIGEASGSLERLNADRKRLTDLLELTNLRIDADRLKLDGLKALSDAQIKARDLVINQSEEASLRSGISRAELKLLADRQNPEEGETTKEDASKASGEIAELAKKLTRSEKASLLASKTSREAMIAANAKMLQADSADARAKKAATTLGQSERTTTVDESAPLEPIAEPPAGTTKPN